MRGISLVFFFLWIATFENYIVVCAALWITSSKHHSRVSPNQHTQCFPFKSILPYIYVTCIRGGYDKLTSVHSCIWKSRDILNGFLCTRLNYNCCLCSHTFSILYCCCTVLLTKVHRPTIRCETVLISVQWFSLHIRWVDTTFLYVLYSHLFQHKNTRRLPLYGSSTSIARLPSGRVSMALTMCESLFFLAPSGQTKWGKGEVRVITR